MNTPPAQAENHDRLIDLLIQRATTGLSDAEQQEFDHLASVIDIQKLMEQFEFSAAAAELSYSDGRYDSLPGDVRDRLLLSAGKYFDAGPADLAAGPADSNKPLPTTRLGTTLEPTDANLPNSARTISPARRTETGPNWRERIATMVAAASLLLWLSGYNPVQTDVPEISARGQMQKLIDANPTDLVQPNWQPIQDKDASGQVVWSDQAQEGYMVFSGLKVNDPTEYQYQLWIFDTDPAQKVPIDGGVFDITSSDTVIPIRAHVPIDRAVQFAVTIERPGGVYVSKRENIPVLAAVKPEGEAL